jgi:hypothetical protein
MKEKFWMFWLLALMVLGMLTSCKTKYVAVPEYHEVVVNKHDTLVQRDSVYERDSIYIIKSGDTVTTYHDRILYRDKWRDKVVYRDSIKVDSVRVPYPVPAQITKWQRGLMNFGYIGLGIVLLLIVTVIIKVGKWLRARSTA